MNAKLLFKIHLTGRNYKNKPKITYLLKIGYSRICACTKIPVFCLPPGPADENKESRPSLIVLQTELLLLYLNGVRRSELVAPNSNSSSSGAD